MKIDRKSLELVKVAEKDEKVLLSGLGILEDGTTFGTNGHILLCLPPADKLDAPLASRALISRQFVKMLKADKGIDDIRARVGRKDPEQADTSYIEIEHNDPDNENRFVQLTSPFDPDRCPKPRDLMRNIVSAMIENKGKGKHTIDVVLVPDQLLALAQALNTLCGEHDAVRLTVQQSWRDDENVLHQPPVLVEIIGTQAAVGCITQIGEPGTVQSDWRDRMMGSKE